MTSTEKDLYLALMIITKIQQSLLLQILPFRKEFWIWTAGTGLLSCFWYKQFPSSEYVLVDISDEMLNVAHRRFAGINNTSSQMKDYTNRLPEGE